MRYPNAVSSTNAWSNIVIASPSAARILEFAKEFTGSVSGSGLPASRRPPSPLRTRPHLSLPTTAARLIPNAKPLLAPRNVACQTLVSIPPVSIDSSCLIGGFYWTRVNSTRTWTEANSTPPANTSAKDLSLLIRKEEHEEMNGGKSLDPTGLYWCGT